MNSSTFRHLKVTSGSVFLFVFEKHHRYKQKCFSPKINIKALWLND